MDPQTDQTAVEEHAGDGWQLVPILVENPVSIPTEHVLILERPRPA